MEEKYTTVDIAACIDDALFITSNKINSSALAVTYDAPKDTYFTTGIANNIEQVFANLVSNACDAIDSRSGAKLSISIEPDTIGNSECWRVDVSDTGSGIPAEKLPDIFQSFYTTKEKGKGTGLGLSITRGIIRDHKGDIEVESTLGEGTTFKVYLLKEANA